jgi:hypothetical protein
MRLKHNKKRNTAFLFETLTREYIKAVVKKNTARQTLVKRIIKDNFAKGSTLNEELKIYREVLETDELSKQEAESMLQEANQRYQKLNGHEIFKSQNKLIKEMNYQLSSDVFGNFVPNYKSLATVYGIFNNKTSIKEKMILERKMVESLTSEQTEEQQHVDNLTYKTFVEGFNKKYADLPENQKDLLTNYIASFSDNSIGLKVFMNEQVSDLKERLISHSEDDSLQNEQLKEKFDRVLQKLETYKNKEIDDIMVEEVLKIQDLVRELEEDA